MLSVIVKVADRSVLFYIIINLSVIAKPPNPYILISNVMLSFEWKCPTPGMCFTGKWRGGWAHLDLADALKSWK